MFLLIFLTTSGCQQLSSSSSPYPPSSVIKGVTWHFENSVRLAPGSDLWPVTWGPDNHIYTSWGDGGGFKGSNQDGRVSLGFARIIGPPDQFKTRNIWGGKTPESKATFKGKSSAILSVDGTLYAWVNLQNKIRPDRILIWSRDLAHSWDKASWKFSGGGSFEPYAFLNFGKDYADARDEYVYIYGNDTRDWSHLYLARVKKDLLIKRKAYEYYTGIDSSSNPQWSPDITLKRPVISNPDGMGAIAIVYNKPLKRYLLTSHHGNYLGKFAFFDGPEPWGPWTTVSYYNDWNKLGHIAGGMPHSFPGKWISKDGKTMYMIFSGRKEWDSFNMIKVTLTLDKQPP